LNSALAPFGARMPNEIALRVRSKHRSKAVLRLNSATRIAGVFSSIGIRAHSDTGLVRGGSCRGAHAWRRWGSDHAKKAMSSLGALSVIERTRCSHASHTI
jgi:hypothetical protein